MKTIKLYALSLLYATIILLGDNNLGTTDLATSVVSDHNVDTYIETTDISKATKIYDVPFDDTAARNDIIVSVAPDSYRPVIVKVAYTPSPWLVYGEDKDYYRVRFIGFSSWAGVGDAGNVVESKSSNEGTTRMNW